MKTMRCAMRSNALLTLLVALRLKALHTRLELYRESSAENTVHEELVMTMAYLKVRVGGVANWSASCACERAADALRVAARMRQGEVTLLVEREHMGMAKHMKTCSAGNAVTLFKESHIAIKRAVVDVAGEQQVDAHWVRKPNAVARLSRTGPVH